EPAGAAAPLELGLLFRRPRRRRCPCAGRPAGRREEVDVDPRDIPAAELDVTGTLAVVQSGWILTTGLRDQPVGHDPGCAFGEHTRLRRSDAVHVADSENAGEPRLERPMFDRDP